jgi:uncharacterized membrane protein SpoIIM required for sporulation
VIGILPHALPELFALFLRLRRGRSRAAASAGRSCWPATFVTTAIAIPILLLAGAVEVFVSPLLLLALGA